jgi:hypothetical protein
MVQHPKVAKMIKDAAMSFTVPFTSDQVRDLLKSRGYKLVPGTTQIATHLAVGGYAKPLYKRNVQLTNTFNRRPTFYTTEVII